MTLNPAGTSVAQPLCVDLDGTLIRTDLTFESLLAALKRQPLLIFFLPFWLLRGRSYLKHRLIQAGQLDVTVLPYHPDVLDLVDRARRQGRPVVLVTGSHEALARQVAEHLCRFDVVLATSETVNLIGANKAAVLEERYGSGRFEYVANGRVDLPVWQRSGGAVTVNAPRSVVRQVAGLGIPHRDIPNATGQWKTWLKAIRLQQWLKNLLLLVPIITAHEVLNAQALGAAVLAFLCFGACASATYLINDLLDLEADRHHHKKKARPFAAGTLDVRAGLAAIVVLLASGLGLAWWLPVGFQLALGTYLVTTLLYSLWLKRVASLDVIVLAGLYTLRIIAGALATGISLSFWLLAFSMFIFLSLALVKRVAELVEVRKKEIATGVTQGKLRGREYATEDVVVLQSLGAASGYLSVLVLALYIHSTEVSQLYRSPQVLWLIAPLMLLWVTRLWVVTARGYMDEDPIFFAATDPETWATGAVVAVILMGATLLQL
ncbi:UbiA family prenyltransferase [Hydrogenophaga pseudoflava]|uniref:UbiA family prenyltransferase n=1 Tax=Hydrogenophaga pseudoflava TaxID=47421 RepID=UPI0027E52447|nr:UbiA family prenyltransferase [Hydrogenophaga pseudoflava]MDQ7744011.1 UbiA family prenyltransferase [Hydrogenophaga pseudoflava]